MTHGNRVEARAVLVRSRESITSSRAATHEGMNTDQLITLVLALPLPEQARICDALLERLDDPDVVPADPEAIAESERVLAAIDAALDELPTNTKLSAFIAHVEAKLERRATPRDA